MISKTPFFTRRYIYILSLILTLQICTETNSFAQKNNFTINKQLPAWLVPVSDQKLKLRPKDISEGYYLSLYENQNHAELEEDYVHINREISSDAGVQNGSQISVTYDPSFQKLIFHKVILWRNGQSFDQLTLSKVKVLQNEKDLSKFIYSGTFDAYLLLDDIRRGDKIEYAYTIKGANPAFGAKIATNYYLEGSSVMAHLYINLIADKKRSFALKNFNHNQPLKSYENGNFRIYEWTASSTKTYRIAENEPSWYNPLKRVQLTEYKNWNEVVKWGLDINNYPIAAKSIVKEKIIELKKRSNGDTKKYIELAKNFIQDEIRYMGIEIGAYSQRPNAPEKVLKQRYGDCKDKSLLLMSLLNGAGISAYMAYVNTETTLKTNEGLPSPFAFNHVIVAVEFAGQQKWIDPTISYQRGNFDQFYAPDYGYVLMLKPGVNTLQKMPDHYAGRLVANSTFHISDTISTIASTLLIKSTYSGHYADDIRSTIAESGADNLDKDYLEYYSKYYPNIEVQSPVKIVDDEYKNVVTLIENYNISDIWISDEDTDKQYFYLYGDLISHAIRKISAKKRVEPVSLRHPINIEQNITVHMPYRYDNSDDHQSLDTKYFQFDFKNNVKGKLVNYHYQFKSLRGYIESSEVSAYRKDYNKINLELEYYLNIGPDNVQVTKDLNDYAILVFILTLVFGTLYFLRLYEKSDGFDIDAIASAKTISGWLVIVGIRVFIGPLVIITHMITLQLFTDGIWVRLLEQANFLSYLLFTIYGVLLIGQALLLLLSLTCIVLFFNKRTTFPKLYIFTTYLFIVMAILVPLLSIFDQKVLKEGILSQTISVIVSVGGSVILILYLKKSIRVRETFVFTYPAKDWTIALIKHYNTNLTKGNKVAPAETLQIP